MIDTDCKNRYATVRRNGGMGFREIAEIMNKGSEKMNHSTVRNHLHRGLMKIALPLAKLQGFSGDDAYHEARRISQDPDFQIAIHQILSRE